MRPAPFILFGWDHLLAVSVTAVCTALAVAWGRRQSPERAARGGALLGAVMVAYYVVDSALRIRYLGLGWASMLPVHLCSALFFLHPLAYWTRHRLAFDVVYFWTFAGTLHALITPTPYGAFPSLGYFVYFIAHGLLILSAAYAAAALRQTPVRGSMTRAFIALQAWLVVGAVTNACLGTNFLYLHHKPPTPTLLDHLGPWPWYIASGEVVAVLSFALWNLPFAARRSPPVAQR